MTQSTRKKYLRPDAHSEPPLAAVSNDLSEADKLSSAKLRWTWVAAALAVAVLAGFWLWPRERAADEAPSDR